MCKYRIRDFVIDAFMFCITGGLWGIWIFIREVRGLRR